MSNLVRFEFHGDTLDCITREDGLYIGLARLCEGVGVDYPTQLRKLKSKPWATMVITPIVAEDGKTRDVHCLHLDSVPMWLATIGPNKVKPTLREKLIAYQRECARVLRDHFFGNTKELRALEAAVAELKAKVEALDPFGDGVIGTPRARAFILGPLKEAARMHCAAIGDFAESTFRREFKDRENQVRLHVEFPASLAQRWDNLPITKFPAARCKINEIVERASREAKRARALLEGRLQQMPLGFNKPN